jgi:hypothetical protein
MENFQLKEKENKNLFVEDAKQHLDRVSDEYFSCINEESERELLSYEIKVLKLKKYLPSPV